MACAFDCRYPSRSVALTRAHIGKVDCVVPRARTFWFLVALVFHDKVTKRLVLNKVGKAFAQSWISGVIGDVLPLETVVRV